MADVVERLRAVTEDDAYASPWTFGETCREAAAEIETLRAERSEAMKAQIRAERRAATAEARVTALEAEKAGLARLLRRYRTETPLGHQPHMIAAEVDQALSRSTEVNDG